jgi:SAM-dependent methyltransferase
MTMLARRELPSRFREWNEKWGAPFGHGRADARALPGNRDPATLLSEFGPFALQPCTTTRMYEYPWVYHQLSGGAIGSVVEVGGGLSGLQFVLSAEGAHVLNVDPGGAGYTVESAALEAANALFRTNVDLRPTTLAGAQIADSSVDAVISVSTLEHLDPVEVESVLLEARRILRPGGRLVLTVDLFLNLAPFTDRVVNQFGRNLPVWRLLHEAGYRVERGRPEELLGGPGFDHRAVLADLEDYLIGDTYPVLAQLVVATSP